MSERIVELKPRPREKVRVTLSGGRFFTIPEAHAQTLSLEMVLEDAEVARLAYVALDTLLDPACRGRETRRIAGRDVDVPFFDFDGLVVWGATAMALSELAERLRQAGA